MKWDFVLIVIVCVALMIAFIYFGYGYRDKAKTWNEAINECLRVCMCPSEMNYTGGRPLKEGEWPFD